MIEDTETQEDRRYVCISCDGVVRARYSGNTSFYIGCKCTSVPVVPQMGQSDTPDCWQVEREDCCAGVDVKELDTVYGGRFADYECPECGATYSWSGDMVDLPERVVDETDPGPNKQLSDMA